jgi:cutinase
MQFLTCVLFSVNISLRRSACDGATPLGPSPSARTAACDSRHRIALPGYGVDARMPSRCIRRPRLGSGRSAGRWVGLGASALFTASVLVVAPSAPPAASATDCPDAEVVFARGTDEPPGLGRVGDAFVDSLRKQTGGMNIDTYAVNYKASKLQLHGGDGAKDTISHIKSTVSSCPDTKIVLGGYSQGASVIDIVAGIPLGGITWGDPLPPQYVNNIAAVATFGDVATRIGETLPTRSTLLGYQSDRLVQPQRPHLSRGSGQRMERTHRGLRPRVHDPGSGFRRCEAAGWDRSDGARVWAGAGVWPGDVGLRPGILGARSATGLRPGHIGARSATGVRPGDAGVRSAAARV